MTEPNWLNQSEYATRKVGSKKTTTAGGIRKDDTDGKYKSSALFDRPEGGLSAEDSSGNVALAKASGDSVGW